MGGRKRNPMSFYHNSLPKRMFVKNNSTVLKISLNKQVLRSMIEFCFVAGPKSLLDEGTWEGLVKVLNGHVSSVIVRLVNFDLLLYLIGFLNVIGNDNQCR